MFQGSMVAIVTPMKADGSVDDDALARLIEFHIEQGTDAIVSVGTTGESATLSMSEHAQVVQRTINLVAGRVPVIAGSGANNTREAIELAQKAEKAGAAAHLSVVPYYNKPTQNGIKAHFTAIADAVELPMILYNVPGRTIVDMQPEVTAELANHANISCTTCAWQRFPGRRKRRGVSTVNSTPCTARCSFKAARRPPNGRSRKWA